MILLIKYLFPLILLGQWASAGLPPTTTKGSGDANPVTTFEIDFPNVPITHAGAKGSFGTVPIAGGGTGQVTKAPAFDALSPMTTGGDLIYGGASGTGTRLANGSAGQVLTSTGGTSAPNWAAAPSAPVFVAPTVQQFISGSGTYNLNYAFIISSGNATVGATYTNNSVTFTVFATVSSATLVYMNGSGPPTASGTLTKASGSGDATLTFSQFKAPISLEVEAIGGGGSGSGSGSSAGAGINGDNTTFGSSFMVAGGGSGGAVGGNGAVGGTNTFTVGSTGAMILNSTAGNGGRGANGGGAVPAGSTGNFGGAGPFGGSGNQSYFGAGPAAAANSGAGGSGAGTGVGAVQDGAGGGAGGYLKVLIPSPSASFSYSIAGSKSGGGAGTAGYQGGASGSGLVTVKESYQ